MTPAIDLIYRSRQPKHTLKPWRQTQYEPQDSKTILDRTPKFWRENDTNCEKIGKHKKNELESRKEKLRDLYIENHICMAVK